MFQILNKGKAWRCTDGGFGCWVSVNLSKTGSNNIQDNLVDGLTVLWCFWIKFLQVCLGEVQYSEPTKTSKMFLKVDLCGLISQLVINQGELQ